MVSASFIRFLSILACLAANIVAQAGATIYEASILGYGEPCNSTQPCDRFADLICSTEHVCECSVPDFMLYDAEQGKCVSLTGLNGSCYMQPIDDFQRSCVKNADCHFRPIEEISTPTVIGYCKCSQDYVDYADLTCGEQVLTQTFGEKCNGSHYCHAPSVLKCSEWNPAKTDGQCECVNPASMEFNLDASSCLSLSVPGSVCYNAHVGGIQIRCTNNAECISDPSDPSGVTGTCSCAFGYSQTPQGRCMRLGQGYGEVCNATTPCATSADLRCSSEGFCTCADPDNMVYEEHQDKCVSLAGLEGSCHFEAIGDLQRSCVSYAQCTVRPDDPNPEPLIGYCKCVTGYTAYEDRTCGSYVIQSYGERCNGSHYCNGQSILKCSDPGQIEGLCECIYPDSMVFDKDAQSCFSLADPESKCYLESIGGIQLKCIENADCIVNPEDISGKTGHCDCTENYVAYEDRTCGAVVTNLGFGQSCNSSHFCDRSAVLACESSHCECMPNTGTFYQHTTETCVSGIGNNSLCHLNPIDNMQIKCAESSGCFQHADNDTGFCMCLPGLVPLSQSNTCGTPRIDLKYEEACNATFICDSNDLLSCDLVNKKCDCKYAEDSYSEAAGKCLSPAGGICYTKIVHGEIRNCVEPFNCNLPNDNEADNFPYGICSCGNGFDLDEVTLKCVEFNSAEILGIPLIWLFIQQLLVRFT